MSVSVPFFIEPVDVTIYFFPESGNSSNIRYIYICSRKRIRSVDCQRCLLFSFGNLLLKNAKRSKFSYKISDFLSLSLSLEILWKMAVGPTLWNQLDLICQLRYFSFCSDTNKMSCNYGLKYFHILFKSVL